MRKEIEKLLTRVNWQIDSLEKSWNNEMESMKYEIEIGNVNRVKTTCERLEQIRREFVIYKSYKNELEGILKMEDEENEITRRN